MTSSHWSRGRSWSMYVDSGVESVPSASVGRRPNDQEASRCSGHNGDSGSPAAGPVKSAARALDLLDEIAANGPGTQLQLSTRLSIPKSSLHALLRTMCDRGWLETDPTGSVYQLGHPLPGGQLRLPRRRPGPVARRRGDGRDRRRHRGDRAPGPARRRRRHLHRQARVRCTRCACTPPSVGACRPTPPHSVARCSPSSPRTMRPTWCRDTSAPSRRTRPPTGTRCWRSSTSAGLLGYAMESEESCIGVRCFGVALPFARTLGRRAERRRADQPPRPRSRGPHHRDAAERQGPAGAVHGNSMVR